MQRTTRRRRLIDGTAALLDALGYRLQRLGARLTDEGCTVPGCGEWPDTGRHQPAATCPGLDGPEGCRSAAEHHPYQSAWWLK